MTTTKYPVDSATRTCCGGIGTHTRACRLDDIPLPPGTDSPSGWEYDTNGTYRMCWGEGIQPADTAVSVAWHANQYANGLVPADDAGVLIDQIVDGCARDCLALSTAGARSLAEALIHAANELDRWSQR